MNIDNGFDLLVTVLFSICPQLGGLVPKAHYLVISFCLGKGEPLAKLYLMSLQ